MNQATAYMAALGKTTSFSGGERQLILNAGTDIVATFVAVSQDLGDTAWDVVMYNNGREAVVGLIAGTEISANFGADGSLTGNASCNEYVAGFTTDGSAITISTPGVTFRFCPEPEGSRKASWTRSLPTWPPWRAPRHSASKVTRWRCALLATRSQ